MRWRMCDKDTDLPNNTLAKTFKNQEARTPIQWFFSCASVFSNFHILRTIWTLKLYICFKHFLKHVRQQRGSHQTEQKDGSVLRLFLVRKQSSRHISIGGSDVTVTVAVVRRTYECQYNVQASCVYSIYKLEPPGKEATMLPTRTCWCSQR